MQITIEDEKKLWVMFDERAHLTKGSVLISSQGGREVRGSSLCYDKIYLIPHKALLYSLDFPPPFHSLAVI